MLTQPDSEAHVLVDPSSPSFSIDSLLDASAYPHPVERLQLLETHISWVVLTGPIAYKIKKPVSFDFLDYSTLELRRIHCEKELEFNRRFAPQLYLEVVQVVTDAGGIHVLPLDADLESGMQTVEYAVKMREFPQTAIVAQRIHHPELTRDVIEAFAVELARLHTTTEQAPVDLGCVQPEQIRSDAEGNFPPLRSALMGSPKEPILETLLQWTRDTYARHQTRFLQRLQQGCVRRGHGDLHLNNLIQLNGRILAFDGVEFNEAFQWCDVWSELAFPVMDFFTLGREDLAWHLFNAYFEQAPDPNGLAVFRFYLVYRALVRAKVTWLKTQSSKRETPDAGSESEWDRYLKTAEQLALKMTPRLAITHGFSGSGKSTAAWNWVLRHGGLRLRSDVFRKQICPSADPALRYSRQTSDEVYRYLLELSREGLRAGFPVVVDATFLHQRERVSFCELASEEMVPFEIIDCDAPYDELRLRLLQRHGDPSEATPDVLDSQMRTHDPLTTQELAFVVPVPN